MANRTSTNDQDLVFPELKSALNYLNNSFTVPGPETVSCNDTDYDQDVEADSKYSFPFDETSLTEEEISKIVLLEQQACVYRCKSGLCQVCKENHMAPTFISAERIDPVRIRQLPKKWWEYDDNDWNPDHSFMDTISNFFCALLEDAQGFDEELLRQDTILDDNDDSSAITWLTPASYQRSFIGTSTSFTADTSGYLREYHVTLAHSGTTFSFDADDHDADDSFSPFDEHQ